jgi:hypothetical protein
VPGTWLRCIRARPACSCRVRCQLAAQVGQGPDEQPGDAHLGNAEAPADLDLGQVPVEPQVQDTLLAFGQVAELGADGSMSMACSTPRSSSPNTSASCAASS